MQGVGNDDVGNGARERMKGRWMYDADGEFLVRHTH